MKNFKPRGHFSEILENDTILGEACGRFDETAVSKGHIVRCLGIKYLLYCITIISFHKKREKLFCFHSFNYISSLGKTHSVSLVTVHT